MGASVPSVDLVLLNTVACTTNLAWKSCLPWMTFSVGTDLVPAIFRVGCRFVMSFSWFLDKKLRDPKLVSLVPLTCHGSIHTSLLRFREDVVLHFFARGATSEKNIGTLSRVFRGFENCHRLANTPNRMKHRGTNIIIGRLQTFRIGFQTLGRLANSTLLKQCPGMMRQIITVLIPRISFRQDQRIAVTGGSSN